MYIEVSQSAALDKTPLLNPEGIVEIKVEFLIYVVYIWLMYIFYLFRGFGQSITPLRQHPRGHNVVRASIS